MGNVQLIGILLVFLVTTQILEFIFAYHRQTRGRWRERAFGRLTMTLMGSLGAILVLTSAAAVENLLGVEDPRWFRIVRLAVFASLPIALLYQRILLYRIKRESREEEGT